MGFFEKIEGSGKSFIIMNLENIDDIPYTETPAKYAKIKINGENIQFYFNGELQNVEKDSNGYYNLNMANSYCWFITVG